MDIQVIVQSTTLKYKGLVHLQLAHDGYVECFFIHSYNGEKRILNLLWLNDPRTPRPILSYD